MTPTLHDFGRCHRCRRALPIRLLDPVVIDDAENLVFRVSDELYGPCCHDRVVQIMAPGSISLDDMFRPSHGGRRVTRVEAAFIRARQFSIVEVR